MADTSDVENSIVALLAAQFYPNGAGQPSVINTAVNIERGWPTEADIRAGVSGPTVLVRVFAIRNLSQDVTRYGRGFRDLPTPQPTLNQTLSGNTITFGGTPASGQFVGILCQGVGYAYPVQANDTLTTIAAAFAAAITGASSAGAALTLPTGGAEPQVSIQVSGASVAEAGRAMQEFVVAFWATTPQIRDAAVSFAFQTLAYVYRLTLGDTAASIATLNECQSQGPEDLPSRAGTWRRDVRVTYDFPLTFVETAVPPVTVASGEMVVNFNGSAVTTQVISAVVPVDYVLTDDEGNELTDDDGNVLVAG